MAGYVLFGAGDTLFAAYGGAPFAETLLYQNSAEAAVANADGSRTHFLGSGFVWNKDGKRFTAGLVAKIQRYDRNGSFLDSLEDLTADLPAVEAAFEKVERKPGAVEKLLLKGDDTLDASHRVNGRALPASLSGGPGNDLIEGGEGSDLLNGGSGQDRIYGADGEDRLMGGPGADVIDGGIGEDVIKPGPGDDLVYGGPDPDVIVYDGLWRDLSAVYSADDYSITVVSGEGKDKIFTALTIATDDATYRYDVPTGEWIMESEKSGVQWLYPDRFVKGSQSDDVIDKSGKPPEGIAVRARGGDDVIKGGELVWAGTGDDQIFGALRAYGEAGRDSFFDCRYADGGPGNDLIEDGTAGTGDVYEGGSGRDIFRFRVSALPDHSGYTHHGDDRITDFKLGRDHLDIRFASDVPTDSRAMTMKQVGADTVIFYAGGTITLKNLDSTGLTIDDLLL